MDAPKLLKDETALATRLSQIYEPHVRELTEFVHRLREEKGEHASIPYFDPWDGGVDAEILYLLEAPGARAKNSGFVSRNNPDETAKNFFEINKELRIERKRTVIWNVVPWYIGSNAKIRPANTRDIATGTESLEALISLLRRLRVVVLVGGKAQKTENLLRGIAPGINIFRSPHPSPMFVNRKPENRGIILECWRKVKMYVDGH